MGDKSTRRRSKRMDFHQLYFLFVGIGAGFVLSSTLNAVGNQCQQKQQLNGYNQDSNDGWKTINVYIGRNVDLTDHIVDTSQIPETYYRKTDWFAQYRQDYLVYRLLRNKTNGYFVDLAANDAVRISNTFSLERFHGWKGLAIEPNPVYWSSLSYRRCDVVAAVVGKVSDEEVRFKFPRDKAPQGGIIGAEFKNKNQSKASKENQRRKTVTLQEIFERFNTPKLIDYISLDVEGAETYVLESFPFKIYRFNVLTVENPSPVLKSVLELHGYKNVKRLKKNSNETLWLHHDFMGSVNVDLAALNIDSESYSYAEK